MRLIIAEKPSVARVFAEFFGVTKKTKGYFYSEDINISWAIGHLIELSPAKSYSNNPWDLNSLPIIPEHFKLRVKPKTKEQFNILKSLIEGADEIINATDAGREGELIFRYIMELCTPKTNIINRLWISSFTNNDIKKAFDNLKPSTQYDLLYDSARSRNQSDWIYGINLTIALTKTLKSNSVLPLGRVQTPTFAMVCKRYLDNKNFKPSPFYSPLFSFLDDNEYKVSLRADDRYPSQEKVQACLKNIGKNFICSDLENKKSNINPPLLFDLTSLQIEANRTLGFTADTTLKIAQSLYEEKKLISYPRTDSKHLTKSMENDVVGLLNSLIEQDVIVKNKNIPDKLIDFDNLHKSPSFNDKKVTDHHAIIPTSNIISFNFQNSLNKHQFYLFLLICFRFLANFSKSGTEIKLKAHFVSGDHKFELSSKKLTFPGWLYWFPSKLKKKETDPLPVFTQGNTYPIISKEFYQGMTKAPDLLSDSSLLSLMENCGKEFDVEDSDIKKAGIGTPATRASIIERIINVNYIERSKKKLIPTELGLNLYDHIKDFIIADVGLTGDIEEKLQSIENGKLNTASYFYSLKNSFSDALNEVKSLVPKMVSNKKINCPACDKGLLDHFPNSLNCNSCQLELNTNFFGKNITFDQAVKLCRGERLFFENLEGKKNKKFNANVFFSKENSRFELQFADPNENKLPLNCPKCNSPLIDRKKFYGCSGYKKNNCDFMVSKYIAQKKISLNILKALIVKGKTPKLKGFTSKKKQNKFDAALALDENKKVVFKFD